MKNKLMVLLGLLGLLFLLAACDAGVPAAAAAPTDEMVTTGEIAQEAPLVVATAVVAEATGSGNGAGRGPGPSEDKQPANPNPPGDGSSPGNGNNNPAPGNGYGAGPGAPDTPITPEGDLTAAEIDALQYMREEEKLARDVYDALYAVWGVPVFSNIAASEQTHMDAVGVLLEAYGVADPAAGNAPGVFTNADLQALYDQLVAQGSQSLADALLAGGAIEEIDILDLQADLAAAQNTAVIQTFERLLAGSENHLRAYATNYERQTGMPYAPQYLSDEAYAAIMNGTSGRGPGQGAGNPGGSGRGPGSGGQGRGAAGPTEGRGGPGNGNQN